MFILRCMEVLQRTFSILKRENRSGKRLLQAAGGIDVDFVVSIPLLVYIDRLFLRFLREIVVFL